jgi:hypothetical protein
MNTEFIPYEQALALKDIGYQSANPIGGYRGGAVFYYDKGSELFYDGLPMYSSSYHEGQIIAPLYQQAFKWFREKNGLVIQYIPSEIDNSEGQSILHHYYRISEYDSWRGGRRNTVETELNEDYEEAELECLKKLIEIVKQK